VGDARQAALGKDKAKHAKELQVGLKINFERVPGYASQLPGGIKAGLAQQLFGALDYVAISGYAPVPAKPDPSHFQVCSGWMQPCAWTLGLLDCMHALSGPAKYGASPPCFLHAAHQHPLESGDRNTTLAVSSHCSHCLFMPAGQHGHC
jgi:hypothetical protein